MKNFTLSEEILDRDYRGDGEAWAAIDDEGEVAGIRHMDDWRYSSVGLPKWVEVVMRVSDGLDCDLLPTSTCSKNLHAIADEVAGLADCPKGPRGGIFPPSVLVYKAREIIHAARTEAFLTHRQKCRAELSELGRVCSGICNRGQFSEHTRQVRYLYP